MKQTLMPSSTVLMRAWIMWTMRGSPGLWNICRATVFILIENSVQGYLTHDEIIIIKKLILFSYLKFFADKSSSSQLLPSHL